MHSIEKYLKAALEGTEKDEVTHDIGVFKKCRDLASKYNIRYDKNAFVCKDEILADAVFKAGVELLLSVGVYCTTTGRVIPIHEEEIRKLTGVSSRLEFGRLREKVVVPNRTPMDSRAPVIIGGPMGGTVSEENFLTLHLSSAKEPIVKGVYSGALEQLGGDSIKVKSPHEMIASLREAQLTRQAAKIADREGLALMGPSTPTISQAYMVVSSDDLFSKVDPQEVYQLDELKVDYEEFYKIIYHRSMGNQYLTGQCPVFGGPAIGTAEGLAIVDVAETIQSRVMAGSSFHASGAVHVNTNSSSAKEVLWASNLSSLALSRNMPYYTARYYWNLAGCCTDMMFYETAAQAIGDTVTGRDMLIGPVGRRGSVADHSSGLESRFMGEIAFMAKKLTLSKADEVIGRIYKKYEGRLAEPPAGKPFNECYQVVSTHDIKPTDEYLALHDSVLSEIKDLLF